MSTQITKAIALVVFSFLFLVGSARAETVTVPIQNIGPTQEEVGQANVVSIMNFHLSKRAEGTSVAAYVRGDFKRKFEAKVFKGVRDPNGVIRILDGHHRAKMLVDLRSSHNVNFRVKVQIVQDYTGWSQGRYARHLLVDLGKGQFSNNTRRKHPAKLGDAALAARVRRLPATVSGCKDSPLRAAIGAALFKAGVDSDHFADYIEFKLGNRLTRQKGVKTHRRFMRKINSSSSVEQAVVLKELKRALLHPKTVNYLKKQIRSGSVEQGRAIIAKLESSTTYKAHRRLQRAKRAGLFQNRPAARTPTRRAAR